MYQCIMNKTGNKGWFGFQWIDERNNRAINSKMCEIKF